MNKDILQNYIIRDFQPEDYPYINEIWELTGMGGAQRGDNLQVINDTLDHGGKLLVLLEKISGRIIGTSWMTHDFRRIYLHHFGIHPDFQRMGLGKLLAKESIKFARDKKMQIKLEVHQKNKAAISLYQKIGFNYLGDFLVYIIRDTNSIKD